MSQNSAHGMLLVLQSPAADCDDKLKIDCVIRPMEIHVELLETAREKVKSRAKNQTVNHGMQTRREMIELAWIQMLLIIGIIRVTLPCGTEDPAFGAFGIDVLDLSCFFAM